MSLVCIALGSNVGNSQANIEHAITLLGKHISSIQKSKLYHSKALPVPGHPDLPDFVNTAICGETELTPQELLQFTQSVEQEVGKVYRFHWGPREIDVDIIFYDDQIINSPELVIPHPYAHERDFVIAPLCDIRPDFIHPVIGCTIKEIFNDLPPSELSVLSVT